MYAYKTVTYSQGSFVSNLSLSLLLVTILVIYISGKCMCMKVLNVDVRSYVCV